MGLFYRKGQNIKESFSQNHRIITRYFDFRVIFFEGPKVCVNSFYPHYPIHSLL